MLAQQVNFFKVSRRDSLGNMMIGVAPMLNAKAKNRHLSEGCSGALRHTNLQLCRAGELRPFEMVIQRRFDKTTAGCTLSSYHPAQVISVKL